MLETVLEKINTNLERLVNAIEKGELPKNNEGVVPQPMVSQVPTMPQQGFANSLQGNAVAPVPVNQINTETNQVAIPTTQQSFTIDQIAVAMSNAMSAGKKEVVFNILSAFNVQTLMQIDPSNYNTVAAMLQEAGVKV